ncbi:uncharacterized protein LOC143288233 [Babylonia areolata]|uniref:uncharacterized protein LOC143288233 n=1 Tax=Babylonia areolata TaxID=304850 RepID=UPI003FCF4378
MALVVNFNRGVNLIHDDHCYRTDKTTASSEQHWRCIQRGCPGRVKTDTSDPPNVLSVRHHDHKPDRHLAKSRKFKAQLCADAGKNPDVAPSVLYKRRLQEEEEGGRGLPALSSCSSMMQRVQSEARRDGDTQRQGKMVVRKIKKHFAAVRREWGNTFNEIHQHLNTQHEEVNRVLDLEEKMALEKAEEEARSLAEAGPSTTPQGILKADCFRVDAGKVEQVNTAIALLLDSVPRSPPASTAAMDEDSCAEQASAQPPPERQGGCKAPDTVSRPDQAATVQPQSLDIRTEHRNTGQWTPWSAGNPSTGPSTVAIPGLSAVQGPSTSISSASFGPSTVAIPGLSAVQGPSISSASSGPSTVAIPGLSAVQGPSTSISSVSSGPSTVAIPGLSAVQGPSISSASSGPSTVAIPGLSAVQGPSITSASSSAASCTSPHSGFPTTGNEAHSAQPRREFFSNIERCLRSAQTFEELRMMAVDMEPDLEDYPICPQPRSSAGYVVDEASTSLFPPDAPEGLVPVSIGGDGNCLPRCASVLAYGNEDHHLEMRMRIAIEMALHSGHYLSPDLSSHVQDLPLICAQYSDCFKNEILTRQTIEGIFYKEVTKTVISGTYLGLWQLYAVCSVLAVPVFSIYPQYGGHTARCHLHHLIQPRRPKASPETGISFGIMWSNTSGRALAATVWKPNHFVACLPAPVPIKDGDFVLTGVHCKKNETSATWVAQDRERRGTVTAVPSRWEAWGEDPSGTVDVRWNHDAVQQRHSVGQDGLYDHDLTTSRENPG